MFVEGELKREIDLGTYHGYPLLDPFCPVGSLQLFVQVWVANSQGAPYFHNGGLKHHLLKTHQGSFLFDVVMCFGLDIWIPSG